MVDLNRMLNATKVVLVGATEKRGAAGRTIMENLLRSGATTVYPVNPNEKSVLDITAFPAVGDIPTEIDLAVIATPAPTVPGIVEECGRAGIVNLVIISAGFREIGDAGRALEDSIDDARKAYGMQILGPESLGFVRPHIGLNATFMKGDLPSGNIAFLAQNAGLGAALSDWAASAGVGFSMIASLGATMGVGFGDLIDFLADDPSTESILVYMEAMVDPRKFMSAARAIARRKPIIVLKPGKFTAGARTVRSPSGEGPGDDSVYSAVFTRAGILRVREIAELFNAARILDSARLPRGPRLAIVTNAGSPGAMAADTLIERGGEVARLSDRSIEKMEAFLPAYWSRTNPVNILGDADIARYRASLDMCLRDPLVDGVLVIHVPGEAAPSEELARAVAQGARQTGKPVIAAWMGAREVEQGRRVFVENNIPVFKTPEEAAKTYAMLYRRRRNLDHLYETPAEMPGHEPSDKERLKGIVREALRSGRTALTVQESQDLLEAYGIPFTGGPERGLETMDYRLALRARKNREFGAVILLGTGGVTGKILNDFSVGLPPLNQTLARMLIEDTTLSRRLRDWGKTAPFDLAGLEEILVDFSHLVEDFPEIAEITLDPLEMAGSRPRVLDANILLDPAYVAGESSRYPHLVIMPYPTRYTSTWIRPDGLEVLLRPIRPEDEPLEQEMFSSLSPETIRMRLFVPVRNVSSHDWLTGFCNIDYYRHMAIIALITEEGRQKMIGVGRLIMTPDFRSAEFALLVRDEYQRSGIGRTLMGRLIEIGRERGLEEIVGEVLTENEKMLHFAHKIGFTARFALGGTTTVRLDLTSGDDRQKTGDPGESGSSCSQARRR